MARKWMVAVLLAGLMLLGGEARTAPKKGSTITVRALSAKVMKDAKFIGASVGEVSRGDFVTFEEAKGDWYKVKTSGGTTGWLHKNNVTESKVSLSSTPGGGTGGASQDEVELAGRGFTPEVEKEYRRKHGDLDFSHVDAIEKVAVDDDELVQFAAEGKVGQ